MTKTQRSQELKRLKILFEDTNDHVLTFALYRDANEQRESAQQLRQALGLPVKEIALKGNTLNPVNVLLDLPKSPRLAVFFTFLGSSLPEGISDFDKFAGYINIQREAFADVPHALVFWLREEQLIRLMRLAPDFWAWRSGVFDFQKEINTQGASDYQELEFFDAPERGRREEQIALYKEILKVQMESKKPDLAYVVRTRLRLASSFNNLFMRDEAREQAQQATKEAKRLGNAELISQARHSLASSYLLEGRHKEAESLLREVIDFYKATYGKQHPEYATHLSSLANLLLYIGRYEEAELLFRQVVDIDKVTYGDQHPNYAINISNFARLLQQTKRYEEAKLLFRQSMEISKVNFGEQHPIYAIAANNLASLLRDTGRYEEAEPLFRQVINIDKATLGEQHPNYADSLTNLAGLLRDTGRYDEANPLFEQAIDILTERLGSNHPHTKAVRNNYQQFQEEQKRLSKVRATP